MNTQMKEYRKATLRLAYLLTLMLWTGSCIDMDINRNPYETTQDELMRENHIHRLVSKEHGSIGGSQHKSIFINLWKRCAGGATGVILERLVWVGLKNTRLITPKSDMAEGFVLRSYLGNVSSYRDIINRTNDPVALAFAKILRVAIMHRSTDMFGPIPYTKVLGDKTEGDGLVLLMTLKRRFMWLCSRNWKKQMKL